MSRLDTAGLASPGSADHPLSPASTPQGGRRASSAHTYTAQGSKRQDYFGSHSNSSKQARPSRPRTHASQLPAEKHPQPDAAYKLSPTPSRRSGDVFTGLGIEKGNDATGMVLDSLTRIELAVVEERFDLMSDEEINRFLNEYGKYSSGDVLSTPRAARRARDDQADSPLFPPSPPSEAQLDQPDHPLRILSRAVREMQEAVKRVQAENVRLQEELQRYRPVKPANAMSLSDGLEEALSTSLTSPSPLAARTAPTHSEPTSFVPTRPKSPTPSIAASITPSIASQDSRMKKDIRSTWTATLWGWGGAKKNGRRRDGSTSHVGTKTQLDLNVPIPPDEEEWRKGDGGSPPSFVAVFLATRLITPDASSILSNDAQPLVARLAHALVSAARDEDIAPREAPGRRRSRENRSRAASAASSLHPPPPAQTEPSKGYDALATTASIGRSLLSTVSGATLRSMRGDDAARPALIARTSSAQVYPTTAVVKPVVTVEPLPSTPLPSVEMASIVADEYQPPTVMLSRQNLGSFFQTNKSGKLHTATRFQGSDPPLTDRYGFIYDIQHASMLKDASAAGAPAPASLSGLIPDDDAWIERKRPKADSIRSVGMERQSSSSSNTPRDQPSTPAPAPGETHRHRNSVSLKLGPTPAKAVTAKDTQPVSSRGASSLQPSNSPSLAAAATVPSPSPAVSRLTVSSLLDQLTEIHDRQQDERKRAWDKWMRKRSNNGTDKTGWSGDMIGVSQMGLAKDADDWKSFAKLVRRGIPLAYRAKIWAECSGATDAIVPGEYAEILSVHANDKSPVQADIEKDVTRTFPSNVYFGGDGHGVPKLRRVLLAYAWRNPNVGYCQGMNMLAATLLLTHTEEEQAFWVLCCMIDRMLPQDYYTPTLLGSRVDQMVLQDLVAAHLPKVSLHLDKLGVDLASVTFGWFLSLFTDCLPVETLFCVWDLFFVEGHDCLFRVAIAILKLNEADLLTCDSAGDLFALVGGMTGRLWAAEKLIQLQHAYRPLITHAEIAQRSATHLAALQPE